MGLHFKLKSKGYFFAMKARLIDSEVPTQVSLDENTLCNWFQSSRGPLLGNWEIFYFTFEFEYQM
jgi:hypothetical protein